MTVSKNVAMSERLFNYYGGHGMLIQVNIRLCVVIIYIIYCMLPWRPLASELVPVY